MPDLIYISSFLLSPHPLNSMCLSHTGYGYSDKPSPKGRPPTELYNFETWANQVEAFVKEVVKSKHPEEVRVCL